VAAGECELRLAKGKEAASGEEAVWECGTGRKGGGFGARDSRIGKIDLDTVYRIGLVLFLGLEDELLEYRIGACDDAVCTESMTSVLERIVASPPVPDAEHFRLAPVRLLRPAYAEPVPAVVYRVGRVC
jgi:hypothetical protein